MDWLTAALAEYRAVLDEKMATMSTQQSTLRIGTAMVGALLVAGLNLWEKAVVPEFILLFLVPVVSYLSLIIWMGELQRMVRCKVFLAASESSINKMLSDHSVPLSWENWLQRREGGKYPHILKWNYRAILILFLMMPVASVGLGLYKVSGGYFLLVVFLELLAVLAIVFWYAKVTHSFYKAFLQASATNSRNQN